MRARPSEREAWKAAAARNGMDLSTWVRLVLNAAVNLKVELRDE